MSSLPNNTFPGWLIIQGGSQFDAHEKYTKDTWQVKTDKILDKPFRLVGRLIIPSNSSKKRLGAEIRELIGPHAVPKS